MGFLLAVFLISSATQLHAATNPTPTVSRVGANTNLTTGALKTAGKTNAAGVAKLTGKPSTAVPQTALGRLKSQVSDSFHRLQGTRAFYPVIIGIPVCLILAVVFLTGYLKSRSRTAQTSVELRGAPSLSARPAKTRLAAIHSCNVLEVGGEARNLWQFETQDGNFALNRQQTSLPGEALPTNLVAKSWRTLFQPRLDVAWLPAEQVFLRVAEFPRSDFNETLAMVELQLEKLSPIPVTQIVWSIYSLPHPQENLQTVIVLIVAREVVEEFLGQLEGQGFMADRLELPLLDQLEAARITEDGAWIYPQKRSAGNAALVAWWYGGVLRNLDLVSLPTTDAPAGIKEQLLQMAWAGEMDGWLKAPPKWHLVADGAVAALWEPPLREGLEQPVTLVTSLPPAELAAQTAKRAARSDPRASLLPLEFSTRYQQQFVDRLWMRGLLAVAGLYVIGAAVYGVALGVATFRTRAVEQHVTSLGASYTNAVQLKARYEVLKDRQELKFAALECWNLTAKYLPDTATLDTLNFIDGKRLTLQGKAPAGQTKDMYEFEGALRKATDTNGAPFFDTTRGDHLQYTVQGGDVRWNFSLELKRVEIE